MFLFDQINGNQTWVGYIGCIPYAVVTNICWMFVLLMITIYHFPLPLPIYFYFPIYILHSHFFPAFDLANVDANKTELKLMGSGFRWFRFTIHNMYLIHSSERNESITKRDAYIKNKCLSFHFFFLFKDLILRLFNFFLNFRVNNFKSVIEIIMDRNLINEWFFFILINDAVVKF